MSTALRVSEMRAEAILDHPCFAQARRTQIEGYLALYSGEPALNKLLVEGARHVIFTFVVCLAAGQREEAPETWLTLSKLQDVVSAHQVGSPGLVEAIVTRMLDRGLLSAMPAPGDRRKRLLMPTEAMLAHDRDLLAVQAAPCAMISPSPALDLAIAHDPAFQRASRLASVAAFGDAMAMIAAHPEMMMFMGRDSGLLALHVMLSSALDSPGGMQSSVPYQQIADRFGVSRSHIRDLVAEAEAAGLMRAMPGGGGVGVELLPPLWPLVDRWIVACMQLFDRCCTEAHAAMLRAAPR